MLTINTHPGEADNNELEPDGDLRLQFKVVSSIPDEERQIIKQLLEGMIIRYEAERWSSKTR